MDIESKTDFQFVTQEALKNVRVDGRPYPVRSQVLVPLGQDAAYFKEALLERQYLAKEGQVSQPYETEWKPSFGERILRVGRRCDDDRDAVGLLIRNHAWMDADRLAGIADLMPAFSYGGEDKAGGSEAAEAIDAIKAEADTRIAELQAAYSSAVAESTETYNAQMLEEETRWDKGSAVTQRRDALAQDEANELTTWQAQAESETAAYEARILELEQQRADGDISGNEYEAAVLAENRRHLFAAQRIDNEHYGTVARLRAECEKDVIALEREHEDLIAVIETLHAERLKVARETCESGEAAALQEKATAIREYIIGNSLTWWDNVLYDSETEGGAIGARNALVARAVKTESFAQGWYDRRYLYELASTPLRRLFADLETMTALRIPLVFFYHAAYKSPGGSVYNRESVEPGYGYDESGVKKDEVIYYPDESPESCKFYFLFGRRSEVGRVEKISADLHIRTKVWKNNGNVTDPVECYVVRTDFVFEGLADENRLAAWDAVEDDVLGRSEEIERSNAERMEAIDKAFDDAVKALEQTRDGAIADAMQAEADAVKAANRQFVEALEAPMLAHNSKVWAWQNDPETAGKDFPYDGEYWDAYYSAYMVRYEAEGEAASVREAAVDAAKAAYKEGVSNAADVKDEATYAQEDAVTASRRNLAEYARAEFQKIEDSYTEAVQDIWDAYNGSVAEMNATYYQVESESMAEVEAALDNLPEDSWEWGEYNWDPFNVIFVPEFKESYEPSEDEETLMSNVRNAHVKIMGENIRLRDAGIRSAEEAKQEALKPIYPPRPNNRGIFAATLPGYGPSGGAVEEGDDVDRRLVGVHNIVVHYRPRSLTGMDTARYRAEQEETS